jgi:hypothetical protein
MSERRKIEVEVPLLHMGQQGILSEARRFNVLECGRRFGKTTLGQHLAVGPLLKGQPVGWFSPTYKLLSDVWREVATMLQPVIRSKSEQERRLELITGGVMDFWSLDNPDAGRGRKYRRVLIDEASIVRDLEQAWQAAIRPTLTDLQGDAWFFGTPRGRNFFHQLFQRGEIGEPQWPEWRSWRRATIDNPHMLASEIEEARRALPSHIFEQEYLGVPAEDGGNPFGVNAIAACVAGSDAELPSSDDPLVWGWDLARKVDYTVGIALDRDGAVCRFVPPFQSPWPETRARIRDATGDVPALVDSSGVGDPVLQELQREGAGNFEGFLFSAPAKQKLMERLMIAVQAGEVKFPDGVIRSELESFEYEYTRAGVRYEAAKGMHDDAVCSLALAVWHKDRARQPGDYGLSIV